MAEDGGAGVALEADGAAGVVAVAVGDEDAHDGRAANLPNVGHASGVVVVLVVAGVDEHGGPVALHEVDVGRRDAEGLPPVGHLVDAVFNLHGYSRRGADSGVVP